MTTVLKTINSIFVSLSEAAYLNVAFYRRVKNMRVLICGCFLSRQSKQIVDIGYYEVGVA